MTIYLLDKSLQVDICYEEGDSEYEDNICMSIIEDCPDEEKLMRADETNLYMTPAEARQLAEALLAAADKSSLCAEDPFGDPFLED